MNLFFWRDRPWEEVVFWALDLEATSYDWRSATILSVGMVPIRRGTIRWAERFYQPFRPPAGIDPATAAVTVHGLLPDELAAAPPIEQVLPEIARRLAGATLLVHWGRLDVTLLKRAFRAAEMSWPKPHILDTVELLGRLERRRHLLEPSPKPVPTQLGAARAFLGLPAHDEHHALHDALATAELMLCLRARLRLERLGR